jgi:hypothetical protein
VGHALRLAQRQIIGGRLPQDSATSEDLLYHSWRTPKSFNACHFCNIVKKRPLNYWGSGACLLRL